MQRVAEQSEVPWVAGDHEISTSGRADHDRLRLDPLLAVLVGKNDPTGQDRFHPRDKGKALASSSTLVPTPVPTLRARDSRPMPSPISASDASMFAATTSFTYT